MNNTAPNDGAKHAPRIVKLRSHSKLAYLGIDTITGKAEPFTVRPCISPTGKPMWEGQPPAEPLLEHRFFTDDLHFLGQAVVTDGNGNIVSEVHG